MFRPVLLWKAALGVSRHRDTPTRFVCAGPGASACGPADEWVPAIFSSAAAAEGASRLNDWRALTHPKWKELYKCGVTCPVNPAMMASRSVGAFDVAFAAPPRMSYCAFCPPETCLVW